MSTTESSASSTAPTPGDVWDGDGTVPDVPPGELFEAFSSAYERLRANGRMLFGTTVDVHALVALLVDKGVISAGELASGRARATEDVQDSYVSSGMGVTLATEEPDKYALTDEELPEIDCADRLPLCGAACCTLRWALTEQDVVEGVVQWDLARPYVNRVRSDGFCVHCDAETRGCGIYAQRPAVCRTYDCRKDERIWVDFERRIVNPELPERLASRRGLGSASSAARQRRNGRGMVDEADLRPEQASDVREAEGLPACG